MAIKNSVSNNFLSAFVDSINAFDCRLSGVLLIVLILKQHKWIHLKGSSTNSIVFAHTFPVSVISSEPQRFESTQNLKVECLLHKNCQDQQIKALFSILISELYLFSISMLTLKVLKNLKVECHLHKNCPFPRKNKSSVLHFNS